MKRALLAYGLIICLALPTAKAWQHALDGHLEIHCREDIPNHVHQAEYNCDFHLYAFSPALQAPLQEFVLAGLPVRFRNLSKSLPFSGQATLRYFALRAPPV